MTLYSIFEKPDVKAASLSGPVVVPERFSWFAMLLPPLYALRHGLWLALLFWIALVAALIFVAPMLGSDAVFGVYVLVALFLGFEAPALRRDSLIARGYQWRGDLIASGEDLAQRDFLSLRK